jgi:hypothetical protein
MSDFRSIAVITETLRAMLEKTIHTDVGGNTDATVLTPVKEGGGETDGLPKKGVNIYLYHISPNPSFRNDDLPTRSSDGIAVRRPRIALDLHYLLTFYGNDAPGYFEPQLILGSVVRTLHSHPILTREQIQATLVDPPLSSSRPSPADEVEQVKFTLLPLSLEELSKLWSVFFQNHYRLSVVYQASAVFIDGLDQPLAALPVRTRNLYVEQLSQPVIDTVASTGGTLVPVTMGSVIEIRGRNLQKPSMILRVGGLDVVRDGNNNLINAVVSNNVITLKLDESTFTGGLLQAGILGVQIFHARQIGTPPVPHGAVESNIVPFVLRPAISIPAVVPSGTDAAGKKTASFDLKFSPKVGVNQHVSVMLNELNPADINNPHTYQCLPQVPGTGPGAGTLTAAFSGIEPATYLARVLVDGAESVLTAETDPAKPPRYTGPSVKIT